MADKFFSIKPGEAGQRKTSAVTVASSTTAGSKIELRVETAAVTAQQVAQALAWLQELFETRNAAVIPGDFLTG